MRAVISAVELVAALPQWQHSAEPIYTPANPGVFFGYDFHLNDSGVHLIEINTNAGGAFLNAELLNQNNPLAPNRLLPHLRGGERSEGAIRMGVGQWESSASTPSLALPLQGGGKNLEQVFLTMFRHEWLLQRGDAPLHMVAIVDESPTTQYLYPEFILAQQMFERAGITAVIADPSELQLRSDGLYCGERKVDMVYNRLTDFSLQLHQPLRTAYQQNQVVLTPHPRAYSLYADKRNLVSLTDAARLRSVGADEATINILQSGIPQTCLIAAQDAEQWWQQRKQWFFKPATGYGGKGSYRGANVTRRVFEEIMQGDYVAQRMTPPGERMVSVEGAAPAAFKFDVRCYVYGGEVQLIAARLYQGQTTNFRTPGGGFAVVRLVS